jgi:hydroxymethylglutaryl-CoA lyase
MFRAVPFESLPSKVRIRDVTLRDGLQSISTVIPTQSKLELHYALVDAGLRELQVTSFVNPRLLPQLGDAESLWAAVASRNVRNSVLVASPAGFDRAVKAGAREMEAVVSVSETFNMKNVRRAPRQSLDEIATMAERSREAGCRLTVAIANCYHCVFEGKTEPAKVFDVVSECNDYGIRDVLLCDTTGYATPDAVHSLSTEARTRFPVITFGTHLHDTRGRALANAIVALTAGIDWFDAALAGLGGCPFAPGVGGNLSLEMFVDTLHAMGTETGIDSDRLLKVGSSLSSLFSSPAQIRSNAV